MTRRLDRVLRAVCATPWAILPEKLEAMLEVLELRAGGLRLSQDEIQARIGEPRAARPAPGGGIAVLTIGGVIAHRMNMMTDISGGTSTEQVGQAFDAAMADPNVAAIVLDLDSPGGAVDGVPELAAKIAAGRGTKPIVAVANSLAASAAYWIASAADELVVTPSGEVGSIGVFTVHLDASELNAEAGLKYTLISAGRYKTEGNPYEPLSADARQAIQAKVDDYYGMFVRAVAKYRGVSVDAVRTGYGEGRVLGARRAIEAGLADRIATLDEVVAELGRGKTPRRGAAAAHLIAGSLAGEAAGASAGPPLEPAPEAKEQAMSTDTAAQNGAAPAPETREQKLSRLAELHPGLQARLASWIISGATVESVQQEVAAHYQGQHAETAVSTQAPAKVVGAVGLPNEGKRPFASFGQQLFAIMTAGMGKGTDPRLLRINQEALKIGAAASGMNEGVGSEGGFFIQPELLPGVIDPVYADDPILSRVTRIPMSGGTNGVKYNVVDETSRVTGSRWGGIQMYWAAEADTATAKKPKLRLMELDLKKLIGIGYLTEELTMDAAAAEALLSRAFNAELRFMLGASIFAGTGAGQPLGFLNSGALVSQAIEATQTIANSAGFISANVAKMLSRVPASLWGQLIWLYNQELLPYLVNATTGASGTVPLFVGAGGLANRPNDTILGRPAFGSELCEAVGTPGDLLAIVPSEYHMIDKGGPQQATSLHVRFLYDEMALKITYRTDGAPVWRTSVTPYKGSNARSPFVALATRA